MKLKLSISVLLTSYCFAMPIFALSHEAMTNIKRFSPKATNSVVKKGSCWTQSIAVTRSKAWRCSVNNSIYDPCFKIPDSKDLICDADPISQRHGFKLRLTKPLPPLSSKQQHSHQPWIIQLTNGGICKPYTGTFPVINNTPIKYYCYAKKQTSKNKGDEQGIQQIFTKGKQMVAQVVHYSIVQQGNLKVKTVRTVPIQTIWY